MASVNEGEGGRLGRKRKRGSKANARNVSVQNGTYRCVLFTNCAKPTTQSKASFAASKNKLDECKIDKRQRERERVSEGAKKREKGEGERERGRERERGGERERGRESQRESQGNTAKWREGDEENVETDETTADATIRGTKYVPC
jgi:hypothetical protein